MSYKSELCCNLWAIFEPNTQVIYALAGRAYALQGTDEDKLKMLRELSACDYQTVKAVKLPERFNLVEPCGQTKKGVTTIQSFYDKSSALFDELFAHIENQLPAITDYTQEETKLIPQRLPSDPLCVTTLLCEDEQGSRRAIVTDEDRKWLEEIGFGSALNSFIDDSEVDKNEVCEEEEDDPLSIRAEIKRYFHGHMDMAKAITECNIYAGAPAQCDLCSGNFIDDGFMVDGAIRGQSGWACMCMNCFGRHAQGLGWGVGQLYKKEGKLGWLQVAGFQE